MEIRYERHVRNKVIADIWYLNSARLLTPPLHSGDLCRMNTGSALYHPMGIESHRGGRHRTKKQHRSLWTWRSCCHEGYGKLVRYEYKNVEFSSLGFGALLLCHEAYVAAKRIEGLFFLKESQLPAIKGIVSFLPEANPWHSINYSKPAICAIHVFQLVCKLPSWPFVGCFAAGRWRKILPLTFPTSSWMHERPLFLTKHPSPGRRQRSCVCSKWDWGLWRSRSVWVCFNMF